ncbi:MAG: putative flippase GtrA [Cyclobacteriaceae bacterium]
MNQELILKFLKFGVVGFSGLAIDFGVTYLCKEKLKLNQYLSNSAGFVLAVISNYYFNRTWTFENTDPSIAEQFTLFLFISLVGLGLSNLIIFILIRYKVRFYPAKLIAIVLVVIWNFTMNYYYAFAY